MLDEEIPSFMKRMREKEMERTVTIKLQTDKRLEAMAATFRERNSKYGDNYITLGKVMVALFPDGITLKTEKDFILYHWMDWAMGKWTRFVKTKMTDTESVHDGAVYMAMIEDYLIQLKAREDKHEH